MILRALGLSFAVLTASACMHVEQTVDQPQVSQFERMGAYVVSSDLERSKAFYEAVFDARPRTDMPVFAGFDIAGGLFAIVSREAFAPDATVGGNVVPYIKVTDIEAQFDHLKAVAPDALLSESVLDEGPIRLFKFSDPDGNIIEYFEIPAR